MTTIFRGVQLRLNGQATADTLNEARATAAKSIIPSSTAYYDPNSDPITYDLDKAKALLAEAGTELTEPLLKELLGAAVRADKIPGFDPVRAQIRDILAEVVKMPRRRA